jgi:hypothetical protein
VYRGALVLGAELVGGVKLIRVVPRSRITGGSGKIHPIACHEGAEGEQRPRSTLSLTSPLDVGVWSTPRRRFFTPGKETRYPLYRRLCALQGLSGRVRKIVPPPGFDPRTVKAVASRCTDWAIPAQKCLEEYLQSSFSFVALFLSPGATLPYAIRVTVEPGYNDIGLTVPRL